MILAKLNITITKEQKKTTQKLLKYVQTEASKSKS